MYKEIQITYQTELNNNEKSNNLNHRTKANFKQIYKARFDVFELNKYDRYLNSAVYQQIT